MASACVNNIGISSESFLDCPTPYVWLSPTLSFNRELPDIDVTKSSVAVASLMDLPLPEDAEEELDPEISSKDFEFRLDDPVKMLPADELFSDGKLVPLHVSGQRSSMAAASASADVRSPDTRIFRHRCEISSTDPYLFSPKAPRCSTRWKELVGLKKVYQNSNTKQEDLKKASSLSTQSHSRYAAKSLKHLLHRSSKSSTNASMDSSLSVPLLKDSDNESASISSSRFSLSSSSSGHEVDDLPRLSLDSDKPKAIARNTHQTTTATVSRARVAKHRSALSSENPTATTRAGRSPIRSRAHPESGVSVDSPRMNSSGKIVFHSLERSSSSPSSFNGGPRHRYRGMERSYSANIRVTPVLNVPVCSLRGSTKSGVFGFPLFSSQQRKENCGTSTATRNHQNHSKNRMDRT